MVYSFIEQPFIRFALCARPQDYHSDHHTKVVGRILRIHPSVVWLQGTCLVTTPCSYVLSY